MIQQPNDTAIEMEKENTKQSEKAPLLNPNDNTQQLDQTPPPNRAMVKSKWIIEIFHGIERVYGIRQIEINGSEIQSEKFIGTPGGKARRIELMDGEKIQTVTFSGLNYT